VSFDSGREVIERLQAEGFTAAEVYVKRGRSRRFQWTRGSTALVAATAGGGGADPAGAGEATSITVSAEEAGWSVRAGAGRSSFFYAATGSPRPLDHWPAALEAERLELPPASSTVGWIEPPEIAEPLVPEDDGWRLLRRVCDEVARRLPEVVLDATLEDGSSEVRIWNHHGVDAGHRGRFGSLRLEARTLSAASAVAATLHLADRSARRLALDGVADRLADLVAVRGVGSIGGGGGADLVLAPEVGARLLAPIARAFVDRPRDALAEVLELRDGDRAGSAALTLIDDGRFAGGLLPAPVDAEGVPAGRRVLIDAGRLADTVLPWDRSGQAVGCRARPSWRDPPRASLSQCWLAPDGAVTPASLVADLADGFYLLDAGEGGSYDLAAGFFSLPVFGFRIAAGRPIHPLGEASLVGDPRRLLHAVCGVAADLRFDPLDARIGAPTLLVRGLTLVPGRDG
jgi:predicted Zn-dependent protease